MSPTHKSKRRFGSLEVLLGTDRYRESLAEDMKERTERICTFLRAAARLLDYYGEQIGRDERVENGQMWALMDILDTEADEVERLYKLHLKLSSPPEVVLPTADVDFKPARRILAKAARKKGAK